MLGLIDSLTSERVQGQAAEIAKGFGKLLAEERAVTQRALSDLSGKVAVSNAARTTATAHLESLNRYARDLIEKRATLVGGSASSLLEGALRVGEGRR
ncbi:hypothetical protein ACHFJ0_00565 [Paracoccus sp. NGMCC 1.201697]|uniref:Phasin family protein n=1 Tax=Paracoccus broussonetiae subsp. drimophilus TaxID=3373869 RepID=A0ABW7LEC8_9RHOB